MHMPNEVVGPVMAGAGFAASAAAVGYSAYRLRKTESRKTVPLLSVLSAFIFAAQMVNFPVGPSSGHLGGGVLLAALLGPEAAILGMAAVLIIQCLLFADGGLLALGLNIFNMGVMPALVYSAASRTIGGNALDKPTRRVLSAAAAAYAAVLAGALLVPFEVSYAKVNMPFGTFLGLMLGIHALIGIGEAAVTAVVVGALVKARPEAFAAERPSVGLLPLGAGILVAALFVGAVVSNFASALPDGLEASLEKAQETTEEEVGQPEGTTEEDASPPTAILPDYTVPGVGNEYVSTGLAGFIGTLVTFAIAFGAFKAIAARKRTGNTTTSPEV